MRYYWISTCHLIKSRKKQRVPHKAAHPQENYIIHIFIDKYYKKYDIQANSAIESNLFFFVNVAY